MGSTISQQMVSTVVSDFIKSSRVQEYPCNQITIKTFDLESETEVHSFQFSLSPQWFEASQVIYFNKKKIFNKWTVQLFLEFGPDEVEIQVDPGLLGLNTLNFWKMHLQYF